MGLQRFLVLALFGLAAQLIDGALGMAYGLTSTTLLLAAGLAPAVASASVHLAEVGTTLVSGAAHWKLGNTDWAHFDAVAVDLSTPDFRDYVARIREAEELVGSEVKAVNPSEHHKYLRAAA